MLLTNFPESKSDEADSMRTDVDVFTPRYSTQNLFFSDRGFKEIMRTKLRVVNAQTYAYNVSIHRVYSGISKEVSPTG